jgi:DHA2 family multidrug resistance protein
VWQGVGFSLVFVALSTAALSTISRARMTEAAGLYNVVRQVMGSVGIAIAATTLDTSAVRYHALLSEDAGASRMGSAMVSGLTSAMQSKGADHYTATQQAMHIMDNLIGRQASVLAYNHVFLLVTSLFVIGLPLVLLLRRGAPSAEAEVMVE